MKPVHLYVARRHPDVVGFRDVGGHGPPGRLVFGMSEATGNIWML